jgi:hypothetical protein
LNVDAVAFSLISASRSLWFVPLLILTHYVAILVRRASISAQRVVDSFQQPEVTVFSKVSNARTSDRPMYAAAHADVKNSEAGIRSTFLAANYYAEEAKKHRDELLAKYTSSTGKTPES